MSSIGDVASLIDGIVANASADKSKRLVKLVFFGSIIFSVVSLIASLDYLGVLYYLPFTKSQLIIVGFVCFLLNLCLVAMVYLQTGELPFSFLKASKVSQTGSFGELNALRLSINELRKQIGEQGSGNYQSAIDEAVASVKNSVTAEVWDEITKRSSELRVKEEALIDIKLVFSESRLRLLDEVVSLGRRGNLNLILGAGTTVIGLSVLGYFVLNSTPFSYSSSDGVSLALAFLPRLSLVLFIQVFAFFFLKLYKSGLAEIKYFQNEITNLELKYSAIRAAFASESDCVTAITQKFAESERNNVLQQGQTTVDLEKHRLESNASSEILKLLPRIIGRR